MSDPTPGTAQILLPQIQQAMTADPRSALVRALLQQGQQNITATPTYNVGSALAKALSVIVPAYESQQLQGQYQNQNAAAQQTLQDSIKTATGSPAVTDPNTGQVTTPAQPPDIQGAVAKMASNPATSGQALSLVNAIANSQLQRGNDAFKQGLVLQPNGGVAPAPGYAQSMADITGAVEGAKSNAQLPAQMAMSAFGKGGYLQPDGSVSPIPNYPGLGRKLINGIPKPAFA